MAPTLAAAGARANARPRAGKHRGDIVTLHEPSSDAFDAFAAEYDARFTDTTLGRWLRRRVWGILAQCFRPGDHILELTCGTGEDAIWLAQQGVRVTATDGSPRMIEAARRKAAAAGVSDRVAFATLDIDAAHDEEWRLMGIPPTGFDGVLSNFGGLNVIETWRPLAEKLGGMVKPGGWLVLAPMGPICPWETLWHVAHADLRTAFRRFRSPATALVGATPIPIWYPAAPRLRRDFAPWFRPEYTESLGLWLPPSYLSHLVDRFPHLFGWLDRMEARTARLTRGWGDHYIIVFRRSE